MDKFNTLKGIAAPLPIVNIDTDMIIPKQFLKTIKRTGLGVSLFYEMRYDNDGKLIEDFVLNTSPYNQSKILVAGDNFGTGSSREHAPWGLQDWGFDAIISTKFADIFRLNSINIGLVPVETSQDNVEALFNKIYADPNTTIQISIEEKKVVCDEISFSFSLDDFSQKRIIEGLDKIDITLGYVDQIESFSQSRKQWKPKLV